jgi:outer membrane protein OmpA-like peptidoglycan-associated protein
LDEQAKLPNAVVFFRSNSSVLSPVAADIITMAARNAGSGTIVMLQASSDHEAGETAQMAAERADAVRLELIHDGIPASAIHTVHADVSRTGIESRRVIVSVMSAASSSPRVATD